MNGRIMAGLLLFLSASVAVPISISRTTVKSCREHPQLVGKCFAVRGRLSVYNGAPAVRLWRMGTRRVLGVSEQRFNLPGYRNLPEGLAEQLNDDNEIVGDFLVCPFTKSKPREMQLVCIQSATNTSVRKESRNSPRSWPGTKSIGQGSLTGLAASSILEPPHARSALISTAASAR